MKIGLSIYNLYKSKKKTELEFPKYSDIKFINHNKINKNVKSYVQSLIDNLKNIKINLENDNAQEICKSLSDENILTEFGKSLYSNLSENLIEYKDIKIDNDNLYIGNNLNPLIFTKVLNGKINNNEGWPIKKQKESLRKTLGTRTINKISSVMK